MGWRSQSLTKDRLATKTSHQNTSKVSRLNCRWFPNIAIDNPTILERFAAVRSKCYWHCHFIRTNLLFFVPGNAPPVIERNDETNGRNLARLGDLTLQAMNLPGKQYRITWLCRIKLVVEIGRERGPFNTYAARNREGMSIVDIHQAESGRRINRRISRAVKDTATIYFGWISCKKGTVKINKGRRRGDSCKCIDIIGKPSI